MKKYVNEIFVVVLSQARQVPEQYIKQVMASSKIFLLLGNHIIPSLVYTANHSARAV
jgi:hypothetical protein